MDDMRIENHSYDSHGVSHPFPSLSLAITPFDIAQRYLGLEEIPGEKDHPFIQWCFTLCGYGTDTPDEIPWCSAFIQHPFWELHLPRSKSARARSWLEIGKAVDREWEARAGFDVVILSRGGGNQPGPEVINAPGHVGLFAGWVSGGGTDRNFVRILSGNQGDKVSIQAFPSNRILGIRRIRSGS